MQHIAVTGGAGVVGRALRKEVSPAFSKVTVIDLADPGPLSDNEIWIEADICDLGAVSAALSGVEGLVHMAGLKQEDSLEAILRVNVLGTSNVYEAALNAGVRRVVYGSSNHATGFYPQGTLVSPDMPMRPDTRYGLSKCWGELVAGLYYDKHGIETLSIRIGNAAPLPADLRALSMWVSSRDLGQLVTLGLTHPSIGVQTVYGVSESSRPWWDNSAATALGYKPLDAIDDFVAPASFDCAVPQDPIVREFQGGKFCSIEHDGIVRAR